MITSPNRRPEDRNELTGREDITHNPPQPPTKVAKGEHEGMMGGDDDQGMGGSVGMGGGASYSTAIEGVGQMLMGAQKVMSILPGSIPPPILQFLEALKTTVPQALQDMAQSGPGMMGALMPGQQAAQGALTMSQPPQQPGMPGQPGMAPPQGQMSPQGQPQAQGQNPLLAALMGGGM